MARGINKVILVGNLGNDPETKYTQGGMAITTLSLATTSARKDRDGNTQEKTEWHRVKLFGKLGEIAGEYLRKGRQVYIEGRIEYGSYEKDGVKHYTTDIVADDMQMLGRRRSRRRRRTSSRIRPFIEVIDSILIAVALLIFAVSLYQLFIGKLNLPTWMPANNLNELKGKLGSLIIMVMSVKFLEHFLGWEDPNGTIYFGIALAVVAGALIAFSYFTKDN